MNSDIPQHAIEQLKRYNEVMQLRKVLNELWDRGIYFPFMRMRMYEELDARALGIQTPQPSITPDQEQAK